MSDQTKLKVLGAVKVLGGLARITSGVLTGCGGGIVGSYMKHHGMKVAAGRLANYSIEGGKKMLQSGWKELHE